MAQTLATPGVYIDEKSSFSNSVAAIPTAVPAFIGYTEKGSRDGQSLIHKPVRISSLAEYHLIFGAGFQAPFKIEAAAADASAVDFEIEGKGYNVLPESESRFAFYDAIRLFFANGGSTCYIVCAGTYFASAAPAPAAPKDPKKPDAAAKPAARKLNSMKKKSFEACLDALNSYDEPTIWYALRR